MVDYVECYVEKLAKNCGKMVDSVEKLKSLDFYLLKN